MGVAEVVRFAVLASAPNADDRPVGLIVDDAVGRVAIDDEDVVVGGDGDVAGLELLALLVVPGLGRRRELAQDLPLLVDDVDRAVAVLPAAALFGVPAAIDVDEVSLRLDPALGRSTSRKLGLVPHCLC